MNEELKKILFNLGLTRFLFYDIARSLNFLFFTIRYQKISDLSIAIREL